MRVFEGSRFFSGFYVLPNVLTNVPKQILNQRSRNNAGCYKPSTTTSCRHIHAQGFRSKATSYKYVLNTIGYQYYVVCIHLYATTIY
jgi:hypothetical protein